MEDVEAEKPDDVVDVENRLWTDIVPQLAVEQQEQDVQCSEKVPPKGLSLVHLNGS